MPRHLEQQVLTGSARQRASVAPGTRSLSEHRHLGSAPRAATGQRARGEPLCTHLALRAGTVTLGGPWGHRMLCPESAPSEESEATARAPEMPTRSERRWGAVGTAQACAASAQPGSEPPAVWPQARCPPPRAQPLCPRPCGTHPHEAVSRPKGARPGGRQPGGWSGLGGWDGTQ